MTIKELVGFTGKTERTLRRWIEKSNILGCDKMSYHVERDYTIDEVEEILKAGSMSKDAVSIIMQNARQPKELAITGDNILMQFMVKMQEQNQQFMNSVINRLERLETKEPKQLLLPSAPDLEPRAYLNQLVREYSQLKSVDFQKSWNILYTEMLYRCKVNIKVKARNEGIKPIDYLEREGFLLTGCSIMKVLING